jgi:dipeptidase
MTSRFPRPLLLALLALTLLYLPDSSHSCTTLAAAPGATWDGSVLLSHSNDGAGAFLLPSSHHHAYVVITCVFSGDVAGNLLRVPAADWPDGALRRVSGGYVPQASRSRLAIACKVYLLPA